MKAVIMAGGKGTRLASVTGDKFPKAMVPVLGKPLLLRQLEQFKTYGIKDFIFVIGHLGEIIQDYFKDGKEFDVSISYIEEKEPLGTAGSFYYLKDLIEEDDFFLSFGDVLFDIDLERFKAFHESKNALVSLFVHPNNHPYDSDLVISDASQCVLEFNKKNSERNFWYHNLVNAGLYLFHRSITEEVKKPIKMDLESELIAPLIPTGRVYAYSSSEYIKDIGTEERLRQAEKDLESHFIEKRNLKHKQKAIFLDRDGTINVLKGQLYKEEDFELEDCVIDAIKRINASSYLAIVITNQPAVARGLCDIETIETIHHKMETLLGEGGAYLDASYYCPHHPDKGFPEENKLYKVECDCRKPKLGMIEKAVESYNIDLENSWFIGDSTVDIQTGKNAHTRTILVKTGAFGSDQKYEVEPTFICENILDAVNKILEEETHGL